MLEKPRLFNSVLIFAFVISALAITPKSTIAQTGDLFFSEYVEGSSNNKALEIYNGTGAAVDLSTSNYQIKMYFNGNPSAGTTINLTGIVANGDVFVVADDGADAAILAQADQPSTSSFFNGDDAIELTKGGVVIDVIGQIGVDPGAEWGSGLTSTADNTLRRKDTMCQGDSDGSDAFDPAIEWDGFAQDTFDGLGVHTADCSLPGDVISILNTTPANGAVNFPLNGNLQVTFSEPVTLDGTWFDITCSVSGSHTADVTDDDPQFILDPEMDFDAGESCTVTVYAENVSADDLEEPVPVMEQDYAFSFTTVSCGEPYTRIPDIQGTGYSSPEAGNVVTTEGIVVADLQEGMNGFNIQDPTGDGLPNTSDGIFIYAPGGLDVNEGAHVRVSGSVSEYKELTEISASSIVTCKTDQTLPAAAILNFPADDLLDFERFEGMLVTIPQSLFIAEYFNFDRYGEIMLSTERFMTFTAENEPSVSGFEDSEMEYVYNSITLDDGRTVQNPDPAVHPNGWEFTLSNRFRGGDLVENVTGVLDQFVDFYGDAYYRIQPTQGADFTPMNSRPETYEMEESDLKVASFNVLNYFTTLDDGTNDICGPSGDMECRGADTPEELTRQRAKILAAMSQIDADVFGLMEIENDRLGAPTPDYAVADLVDGLNAIAGAGTYDYIATGAIGTDAIKQALIYKPANVTPVGSYQTLTSAYDSNFIDDKNRPTLAQVFEDNLTGETFVVAVNHLKSKGSECVGDPDLGDGAGNCNLTRKAAAEVLVDWLADATIFPEVEKVLIIGDLNSYDKEDPIDAIKVGADDVIDTADDYVDMIHKKIGEYAYGYVFDGHIGYLDYALVNKSLETHIKDVTIWHINADEPDLIDYDMSYKDYDQALALYNDDPYRSSDHDPVLVSLSFRDTSTKIYLPIIIAP